MRLVKRNFAIVILSAAKRSRRIPRRDLEANATGFLDFARNDSANYNNFNRVKSCESTIPTGTLSSSITTRSSMR